MKQLLSLLFISFLLFNSAGGQVSLSDKYSTEYTGYKTYPVIGIGPMHCTPAYYVDVNGVIREEKRNDSTFPIDRSSMQYRILKRNNHLAQNKFGEMMRNNEERNLERNGKLKILK